VTLAPPSGPDISPAAAACQVGTMLDFILFFKILFGNVGRLHVCISGARARNLVAAPPLPRPALPHLWAGPPNFGASVVVTAHPTQRSKETIGAT
jgi:hypothetical protein